MYLKFIGNNGSMGLIHNKIYNVDIKTENNFIWVIIYGFKNHGKVSEVWRCPYSSPKTFSENWEGTT